MGLETPDGVPDNLKSRLKDSYDAIAEAYTEWSLKTADIRVGYLDKLLALLSPTQRDILEVGCGAGVPTTTKLLAHSPGVRVTANDLSTSQIALGKKLLGEGVGSGADRVRWVEGDMMRLEYPAATFDVVLSFYALQHLPRDEQSIMMRRMIQWLKPGGYILFNLPASEDENVILTGWMGEKGWVYYSGWGAERYRQIVKEMGLRLILDEVKQDNVKADFLWMIGQKPVP